MYFVLMPSTGRVVCPKSLHIHSDARFVQKSDLNFKNYHASLPPIFIHQKWDVDVVWLACQLGGPFMDGCLT